MELFKEILSKFTLHNLNILFIIGVVLFGGTIGGRLFQRIKIPQVVGYILLGILVGQTGAKFLSAQLLDKLDPINSFALGLISFSLGGEIKLNVLKKYGKIFTYILFFEALGAFFIVSTLIFIISHFFLPFNTALVLALLLGSISAATAAAGTTDVLSEYRAKGILTTTILGIVALDDVLALFLFAVLASLSSMLLGTHPNLLSNIGKPLYEIIVAVGIGLLSGYLLSKFLKKYSEEDRIFVFSMGTIILVLGIAILIDIDMLMTATLMGFALTNFAPKKSTTVLNLIDKFSGPIYILFFVFVGAKIELNQLSIMLVIMVGAFVVSRILGKAFGVKIGAFFSKAPAKLGKYLPFCLFSQSGVAIGLSILAYQRFPGEIGKTILTVVATSTFIVQIIGPLFLKSAINKAEEAGLNITDIDILKSHEIKKLRDKDFPLIFNDMTLKEILAVYGKYDYFSYPVVNKDKQLLGIISFDNIKNALNTPEISSFVLADDIMTDFHISIPSTLTLYDTLEVMKKHSSDALPVAEEGKIIGIAEEVKIWNYTRKQVLLLQQKAAI